MTDDTRPETRAELKALCHNCGAPAACIGRYEMMTECEYACDDCCGHGNEDGWCWLMSEIPDEVDALLAQPTQPDAVEALRIAKRVRRALAEGQNTGLSDGAVRYILSGVDEVVRALTNQEGE